MKKLSEFCLWLIVYLIVTKSSGTGDSVWIPPFFFVCVSQSVRPPFVGRFKSANHVLGIDKQSKYHEDEDDDDDETRPDQTRPDQTRPDQTRPDQTTTQQNTILHNIT